MFIFIIVKLLLVFPKHNNILKKCLVIELFIRIILFGKINVNNFVCVCVKNHMLFVSMCIYFVL